MFFVEWWNGGRERWDRLASVGLGFMAAHRARELFKLEHPENVFRLVDSAGIPLPGVL